MHAKCAQSVLRRNDRTDFFSHADVPELDFTVATSANELPHSTSLHVDVGNPLLVAAVSLNHCGGRLLALVEHLDLTIAHTGDKNIPSDLVRREGGDARI